MESALAELIAHLELEPLEQDIFRGQSRDIGTPQVYGGQVLGQALAAASRTVQERRVHSLHAYFLLPGDVNAPIVYEVDRASDGRSFSNRRVVAIQHGRQIFNMAASFHRPEPGPEHQRAMPAVPGPDELKDVEELARAYPGPMPSRMQRFLTYRRPFAVRPVEPQQLFSREPMEPVKHVWMKSSTRLPDDDFLHAALFTYVSDYELIGTATLPHGAHATRHGLKLASLDHAMWFHRPVRVDEWLLFALHSPNAAGARGFSQGYVYTQDGVLVATMAQEGLMRPRTAPPVSPPA